jgi:hypothetical protein
MGVGRIGELMNLQSVTKDYTMAVYLPFGIDNSVSMSILVPFLQAWTLSLIFMFDSILRISNIVQLKSCFHSLDAD